MIAVEHISKKYKGKVAVDDLSFQVETGKVTGFLGPNGAGKSTTMRLMLGLDNGKGATLFDDRPLHSYSQPSQIVGILLEAKAFHPTRSARQHLRVLADAGAVPQSRVDEVLADVGLTEVAKKKPGKFSLGMSQRLGIAAAILGRPKYLMLDEPANGLDPEGIAWLRDFLKYYAGQGNAVFVSSHLLSEMSQMADNLVVIGKGKLIADTSVNELLSSRGHSSVFVRSPKLAALQRLAVARKLAVTKSVAGLEVGGITSDALGKLAYEANIPIYELSPRMATLEETFLEITAGSQEYVSSREGKTK